MNRTTVKMTTNPMYPQSPTFTFENSELNRQITVVKDLVEDNDMWEIIQFEDEIPSAWDTPEGFEYESSYEALEMALIIAQQLISL